MGLARSNRPRTGSLAGRSIGTRVDDLGSAEASSGMCGLQAVVSGYKPKQPSPVVRHEVMRKPRQGPALPGEEARGAGLGGGRRARERRDDALAVDLEGPLLFAAHQD